MIRKRLFSVFLLIVLVGCSRGSEDAFYNPSDPVSIKSFQSDKNFYVESIGDVPVIGLKHVVVRRGDGDKKFSVWLTPPQKVSIKQKVQLFSVKYAHNTIEHRSLLVIIK